MPVTDNPSSQGKKKKEGKREGGEKKEREKRRKEKRKERRKGGRKGEKEGRRKEERIKMKRKNWHSIFKQPGFFFFCLFILSQFTANSI